VVLKQVGLAGVLTCALYVMVASLNLFAPLYWKPRKRNFGNCWESHFLQVGCPALPVPSPTVSKHHRHGEDGSRAERLQYPRN